MFSPQLKLLSGILLLAGIILFALPQPGGLSAEAWQLAIIFVATIVCVLSNVLPIFVAAIAGVAVAVLSGVMEPAQAYRGFSENFILLIAPAFPSNTARAGVLFPIAESLALSLD